MDTVPVGRRILARAAARLGGVDKLAEHLKISQRLLNRYITGDEPVPEPLVPLAIDVLLEGLPAVLPEQLTKKNTDSPAG